MNTFKSKLVKYLKDEIKDFKTYADGMVKDMSIDTLTRVLEKINSDEFDCEAVTVTHSDIKNTMRIHAVTTETKYHELLMAVETKYPSESRHETALRYIKEVENKTN